jgi:hypothetical protein
MDFTHEGGFTQESLRQVLDLKFASIEIHPIDSIVIASPKQRIARRVLRWLIDHADYEAAQTPYWARSLLAVAQDPRSAMRAD